MTRKTKEKSGLELVKEQYDKLPLAIAVEEKDGVLTIIALAHTNAEWRKLVLAGVGNWWYSKMDG